LSALKTSDLCYQLRFETDKIQKNNAIFNVLFFYTLKYNKNRNSSKLLNLKHNLYFA